jgi:hypothetical protein
MRPSCDSSWVWAKSMGPVAAELAREGMTQSSPPICIWRPGDAEALRIVLSIPVTSPALAALNREMALLQTHYPTGVCTAQGHLDAIAALNEQLAGLTPAGSKSPCAQPAQGRGRRPGAKPAAAEQVGGGGVRHRAAARGHRERVEPCRAAGAGCQMSIRLTGGVNLVDR